ncbi:MAG: GAF domain-containing protein, partial [Acidimicrobiales bacterium]
MARRVAELVAGAAGADACFVHFLDSDANELVLMGATPESFDELGGTIRLRVGEGIAGWVAKHTEPVIVENKWEDPRYVYIPALRGEDFSSLVSVPMLRPGGVVVGVLNTHSHHPNHFSSEHADRLFEVATLLAGIVENSVLMDRLARREEELAEFAANTIELQENDRRRVAADIHDGI